MAKFADILQAIRKEIVRLRVVEDINRIMLVARRTAVPNLVGDKDIIIRVNPTQVMVSVEGEGRFFTKLRRLIEVIPRVRTALDPVGRDDDWLTDESLGFLAFEDAVIDALQLFQPMNIDETAFLIIEPMRLVSVSNPDKPNEPNSKWGSSVQSWEIVYQAELDQSRQ